MGTVEATEVDEARLSNYVSDSFSGLGVSGYVVLPEIAGDLCCRFPLFAALSFSYSARSLHKTRLGYVAS